MIALRYSCTFLPHRREKEDEDAHLVCRVKWNGSRSILSLNLGYMVNPDRWDYDAMQCQKRTVHGKLRIPAQTINNEITRYRQTVDCVMDEYAKGDVWPTVDQMRSRLRTALGIDAPEIMLTADAFRDFIREESIRCAWSESTIKKLNTVKKHLNSFQPFTTFAGFTTENFTLFLEYLRNDLGHNDVTCHRQLGYVRWFCAWAEKKHFLACNDYETYRPKLKKPAKPVVFLKWDELMSVWSYEAPADHTYLNDVRDIFLFCCFTSLRYSDAVALTWEQVGQDSIRVVAQKTAKAMTIELNKWSIEILSRHIDRSYPGNTVFPRIPNQVMNRYLKTICQSCGINEKVVVTEYHGSRRTDEIYEKWGLIGTHAGRRTFICNALMMGIPPSVIMEWTGHSDYRAMKPYIGMADDVKAEKMKLFNRDTKG